MPQTWMGVGIGIGFISGLTLTLAASELLARGLTRLAVKLGLSEGLLGLLGALGADAPELSSAVIALAAGAGPVGVGVIVGSNLFNLAALLGLSAVVVGSVAMRRGPILLDAATGLLVTVLAAAMVEGWISPPVTMSTAVLVVAAYAVLLSNPSRWARRIGALRSALPRNVFEVDYEPDHDLPRSTHGSWLPVYLLPVALAGVLAGSFVMVYEALSAGPLLHISDEVLGTIVLASLTSLPNLYVALHFARAGRGTALFSAAMNSNTINLLGGLIAPALVAGTAAGRSAAAPLAVLVAMTVLASVAPLYRARLGRAAGVAIIGPYLLFAAVRIAGSGA